MGSTTPTVSGLRKPGLSKKKYVAALFRMTAGTRTSLHSAGRGEHHHVPEPRARRRFPGTRN